MKFEDAAKRIDPEIYARFKQAVELGKWPDGRPLSREQKEICLQAIMLYESTHQLDERERVGFVDSERKTSPCGTDKPKPDDADTIRILH